MQTISQIVYNVNDVVKWRRFFLHATLSCPFLYVTITFLFHVIKIIYITQHYILSYLVSIFICLNDLNKVIAELFKCWLFEGDVQWSPINVVDTPDTLQIIFIAVRVARRCDDMFIIIIYFKSISTTFWNEIINLTTISAGMYEYL